MNKLALLLVASLMLVACASPKPTPTAPANAAAKASTDATPAVANSASASAVSADTSATVATAASAKSTEDVQKLAVVQQLQADSIYFDFDQYAIKPEFRATLEKQAAFLKMNTNLVVVLEGNADERGSAAYNFALGEKRSSTVKKGLVLLGVSESQTKVVSYGNSRPKLACHEEKCWHENRRVDFAYKLK